VEWSGWRDGARVVVGPFIGLEEAAHEFSSFEAQIVPGLFQTEDYARAVIRAVRAPDRVSGRHQGRSRTVSTLEFRRSSHSGGSSNCVEVADTPTLHAVRDSKTPGRPLLVFSHAEWHAFLADVANL
jgi:hypothetical protein